MNNLNAHITGLQLGEDESFLYIFNFFEKSLLNHIFKMVGNYHQAEEIFQEVMLKMISKIDQYEHRADLENSFKAWLFRIATNSSIDEIRKSKTHLNFNDINPATEANQAQLQAQVEVNYTGRRINYLIDQLPVIQRTVLNLKVNEQMSLKEIALICKCEINAVKQSLFRARRSLKDLMIGEGII